MKKGRELLFEIRELMGDKATLDEIIVAMSESEAYEMAEWIDRHHDLNLIEELESENEI